MLVTALGVRLRTSHMKDFQQDSAQGGSYETRPTSRLDFRFGPLHRTPFRNTSSACFASSSREIRSPRSLEEGNSSKRNQMAALISSRASFISRRSCLENMSSSMGLNLGRTRRHLNCSKEKPSRLSFSVTLSRAAPPSPLLESDCIRSRRSEACISRTA